jgi:multidrug resistance efflux pump
MVLAMVFLTIASLGAAAGPAASTDTTATKSTAKKDAKPSKTEIQKADAAQADVKEKHGKKGHSKKVVAKSAKAKDIAGRKNDAKESESSAAPDTVKVKKQRFKIDVTLDGIFEAQHMTEVVLRSKEWSDFEVLSAVEHGTRVNPGDVLATLDTEKIDKTIGDLCHDQVVSRLALQEAESLLVALRATVPLDLAATQRSQRIADEDLSYFLNVDRPLSQRIVDFNVKLSENNLAYEKEELRQLEKMYKADDLVEETEEIILKRTRDTVERAKFMVELMKSERDNFLKMRLPRVEETVKTAAQRQALDTQKTKATLPLASRRAELALEKLKVEAARSEEKLKRLMTDRAAMIVKAPVGGVVYYGRYSRGKWGGLETIADKLRRGGRLTADDVFMTIVETRPLLVRTLVSEKQLQFVTAGLKAIVRPTSYPDLKLAAIVQSVGRFPLGSKEFDARLTVATDEAAAAVVPGMTCDVKLIAYQKPDALVVPVSTVGSDDNEPQKQYVSLVGKDGKTTRREVTAGKRNDKQIEILGGLVAGDEILEEYATSP